MTAQYRDPANGDPSTVGEQIHVAHFDRHAMIKHKDAIVFGALSDTTRAPKHTGRKVKGMDYVHILSEENINTEGIDAMGTRMVPSMWYVFDHGEIVANLNGYPTREMALASALPTQTVDIGSGYLTSSSKDIGKMVNRFPVLGENSGDVNRVTLIRVVSESTFEKAGFHEKYTNDSEQFDSDDQYRAKVHAEMYGSAVKLNEDQLQVDLLAASTTIRYGGAALSMSQVTGEGGIPSEVEYMDLVRLQLTLDDKHAPNQTRILSGTKLIDTRVIPQGRVLFIGTELMPTILEMKTSFDKAAYIPAEHYAAGTTLMNNERGRVGSSIIVTAPRMAHYAGKGALVTSGENQGYRETDGRYDVFPMMTIASGAFTQIGFESGSNKGKFTVKHVMPRSEGSYARDVYGETGFSSILWWYGVLVWRPEWIGVVYTVGKW